MFSSGGFTIDCLLNTDLGIVIFDSDSKSNLDLVLMQMRPKVSKQNLHKFQMSGRTIVVVQS